MHLTSFTENSYYRCCPIIFPEKQFSLNRERRSCFLYIPAKRRDKVGSGSYQPSLILPDQGIAAFRMEIVYPTGECIDITPIGESKIGSDQRAAFLGRFYHDRRIRHTGNNPVTPYKVGLIRFRSTTKFSQQTSAVQHIHCYGTMRRRINTIQPVSQHTYRRQVRFKRSPMGTYVDTISQSAYDQ